MNKFVKRNDGRSLRQVLDTMSTTAQMIIFKIRGNEIIFNQVH